MTISMTSFFHISSQYKANCAEQLEEGAPNNTPADSEDMPDHAPPLQPTACSPQTPSGAYVGMSGVSSWGSAGSSPPEGEEIHNARDSLVPSPRHQCRRVEQHAVESPGCTS